MAKRKKKAKAASPKAQAKSKKNKKPNPIATLMREHSSLSRDEAKEIVDAGLSHEEWKQEKKDAREAKRKANQERMITHVLGHHELLTREHAIEIIEKDLNIENFIYEQREKERKARVLKFQSRPTSRSNLSPRVRNKFKAKKKSKAPKKTNPRSESIEKLMSENEGLTRAVAGQIISGHLPYERYLALRERNGKRVKRPPEQIEIAKQKAEERKLILQKRVQQEAHLGATGDDYFQSLSSQQLIVEFQRFHANSMYGVITEIEPFRLFLKTERNPSTIVVKRHCSFVHVHSQKDVIAEQLELDLDLHAQMTYPPRSPDKRYKLPEEYLESGKTLSVKLYDGIIITGTLSWFDRFQLMFSLDGEHPVFVFRHAVLDAAPEALKVENQSNLKEFLQESHKGAKRQLQYLTPDEITIPIEFDDFPVKDELYEKYVQSYSQEDPWKFPPIRIRREGQEFVLLDGYRRLVLAKEKQIEQIPVEFA